MPCSVGKHCRVPYNTPRTPAYADHKDCKFRGSQVVRADGDPVSAGERYRVSNKCNTGGSGVSKLTSRPIQLPQTFSLKKKGHGADSYQ